MNGTQESQRIRAEIDEHLQDIAAVGALLLAAATDDNHVELGAEYMQRIGHIISRQAQRAFELNQESAIAGARPQPAEIRRLP